MVQQFITYGIEFVFWAFAAHTVLYFTSGFMARRNRIAPGQLSLNFDAPTEPEQAIAPIAPVILVDEWVWTEPATADDAALVDRFSQYIAGYWAIVPTDNVVPFKRPQKRVEQAIDWAAMAPVELRKACQKAGIRWRNAHGANKHLSKAEMVQALSQSAAA